MDAIFYVKKVGELTGVQLSNGESIDKRNVVLTSRECRVNENGVYAHDQDFAVDILGDRAKNFQLKENTWVVATLSFSVREYNSTFYPEIRLVRYCEI